MSLWKPVTNRYKLGYIIDDDLSAFSNALFNTRGFDTDPEWLTFLKDNDILSYEILADFGNRQLNFDLDDMNYISDSIGADYTAYKTFVLAALAKMMPAFWSKNAYKYKTLYATLNLDYNPIWNYDGTNTTTRTLSHTGTDTLNRTGTDTYDKSGSDTLTHTGTDSNSSSGTTSGTATESTTTFDSTSFFDTAKTITSSETSTSSTDTKDLTDTTTYGGKDTNTKNLTDTTTYDTSDKEEITEIKGGNQGVTTTQQMINEEREVAVFSFIYQVAKDVSNYITYAVY